jgi:uncharacterized repeat protein (TIGR02543 family)
MNTATVFKQADVGGNQKIGLGDALYILQLVSSLRSTDQTYTVTYDANTGTGSVPADSNHYLAGATVSVLGSGAPTKTGYTFTCWNTQADGSGTDIAPLSTFAMGAANVTLYAKWGVFLERGEGFAVSASDITAPAGGWIKKLEWDLTNDGSSDITWNRTDTNGDSVINGSDAGPNYNLTLTWAQMGGYAGLQAVGQHPIRWTVTDSYNASISNTVLLTIVDYALVARITVTPIQRTPTTLFTFDGSQSEHLFPGQAISSWQWNFGDGSALINGQIVEHTFNVAGTFTITLRVSDLSGHQRTTSIQMTTQ